MQVPFRKHISEQKTNKEQGKNSSLLITNYSQCRDVARRVPTTLFYHNLNSSVRGFYYVNTMQRAVLACYIAAEQVVDAELALAHDATGLYIEVADG